MQRRDTLQQTDDITAMVAQLPYKHREDLRSWIATKQREDALNPSEAASLEQFRKELHGAAPWVRADDRRIVAKIIRAFSERA